MVVGFGRGNFLGTVAALEFIELVPGALLLGDGDFPIGLGGIELLLRDEVFFGECVIAVKIDLEVALQSPGRHQVAGVALVAKAEVLVGLAVLGELAVRPGEFHAEAIALVNVGGLRRRLLGALRVAKPARKAHAAADGLHLLPLLGRDFQVKVVDLGQAEDILVQ